MSEDDTNTPEGAEEFVAKETGEATVTKTPLDQLREMGPQEYQRRCLDLAPKIVKGVLKQWQGEESYQAEKNLKNAREELRLNELSYRNFNNSPSKIDREVFEEGLKRKRRSVERIEARIEFYHQLEKFKPLQSIPSNTEEVIKMVRDSNKDFIEKVLGQGKGNSTIEYNVYECGTLYRGEDLSEENQDFLKLMENKKKYEEEITQLQIEKSRLDDQKLKLEEKRRVLQELGINPDNPSVF